MKPVLAGLPGGLVRAGCDPEELNILILASSERIKQIGYGESGDKGSRQADLLDVLRDWIVFSC